MSKGNVIRALGAGLRQWAGNFSNTDIAGNNQIAATSSKVTLGNVNQPYQIVGPGIAAGREVDMTPDRAIINLTMIGFTTSLTIPGCTINRMGNWVSLHIPAFLGNSNSTNFIASGIPDAFLSGRIPQQDVPVASLIDNGIASVGAVTVQQLPTQLIFHYGPSQGLFTASGLKGVGLNGCTIQYMIDK